LNDCEWGITAVSDLNLLGWELPFTGKQSWGIVNGGVTAVSGHRHSLDKASQGAIVENGQMRS